MTDGGFTALSILFCVAVAWIGTWLIGPPKLHVEQRPRCLEYGPGYKHQGSGHIIRDCIRHELEGI